MLRRHYPILATIPELPEPEDSENEEDPIDYQDPIVPTEEQTRTALYPDYPAEEDEQGQWEQQMFHEIPEFYPEEPSSSAFEIFVPIQHQNLPGFPLAEFLFPPVEIPFPLNRAIRPNGGPHRIQYIPTASDGTMHIKEYTLLGQLWIQGDISEKEFWDFKGHDIPAEAYINDCGIIRIKLRRGYSLDLTVNRCVRMISPKGKVVLMMNPEANIYLMLHSTATVVQSGDQCDVEIPERYCPTKYATIGEDAIIFTHSDSQLTFALDNTGPYNYGLRTWEGLDTDYGWGGFQYYASIGSRHKEEAKEAIEPKNVDFWTDENKNDHYLLKSIGIHITQTRVGGVKVVLGTQEEYHIKYSPCGGAAEVQSPKVYMTASTGRRGTPPNNNNNIPWMPQTIPHQSDRRTFNFSRNPHLFVRQASRRVHYGNKILTLRFGPKSCSVDKHGLVSEK